MRALSRLVITGAATAVLTAAAGWALVGAAQARMSAGVTVQDGPQSIVEDYSYPGAAEILATHNVKLISGDGHILFAPDCDKPRPSGVGRIIVRTSAPGWDICFDVLGPTGLLNLEVPAVYEIDARYGITPGHKGTVDITPEGGTRSQVPLETKFATQVGQGADPNGEPTTLLQIAIKKA